MTMQISKNFIRVERIVFCVFALLTLPVFWFTSLDITLQRFFYDAGLENVWFLEKHPLALFFYHSAPVFVGILGVSALALIVSGVVYENRLRHLTYGVFVFLTVALGPGLVVNGIFKNNWGRPRPVQIHEFGGDRGYLPPLQMGSYEDSKSFPCGHCSVGFALAAFWFLLRRQYPVRACAILILSLIIGLAMGVGRMAAGGHFFSDTLWSFIFVYGVMLVLDPLLLANDSFEKKFATWFRCEVSGKLSRRKMGLVFAVAGLLIVSVLFAIPYSKDYDYKLSLAEVPMGVKRVTLLIEKGNVNVKVHSQPDVAVVIKGYTRAFGFPKKQAIDSLSIENGECVFKLNYIGVFSDLYTQLDVSVNPVVFEKLRIQTQKGKVKNAVIPSASFAVEVVLPMK